jgi:type II secretory pathway component PulM
MRRSEPGARSIKSLSYVSLVAPMIEGMQEQQAEIDQLQTGLTAVLKTIVKEQQAEIRELWAAIVVVLSAAIFAGFRLWRTGKV